MSLNGLDDPKVLEAYQASVAEPGGWFLLKYASRDEINLLGRGSGGIVDIRTKIAEYEETSPLYGFLRYRRRNVLIKYLPEDCSRLIQARVAVHFNAVCERFSPYDTTFEITTAKELKDTKLSAACSLHAASGSNSSASSSIRRRRLVEIAEEEEEEQQQRATKRQSRSQEGNEEDRPRTPKSDNEASSDIAPVTLNSDLASSPEEAKFSASSTSEVPNFVGVDETSGIDLSGETPSRLSSQSARPDYMTYPYVYGKPKVKLGPRPSVDSNGRPRTAGSYRPVSQMPAGIKMFGKGSKKGKKEDDSLTEDESTEILQASTKSITEEDRIAPIEVVRPATSSGVSIAATIVPLPSPSKNVMSPEKARLMKAMKLREKKQKKKNNLTVDPNGTLSPELLSPSSSEFASTEETVEDDLDVPPSMSNTDSAIGLDASSSPTTADHASEVTQTDSHPASPVIASSEADHSTKASSISESTDETVEGKDDDISKHPDDVFAISEHEKEKDASDATESNSETPVASISAVESPAEVSAPKNDEAVSNTDSHPAEKPEAKLDEIAAPNANSDNIPTTETSAPEESANDCGPKTDKIPDAAGTTESNDENSTPTLRISTATIPDAQTVAEQVAEKPVETPAETPAENPSTPAESSEPKPKRKTAIEPIRTDLLETRPDSRVSNISDDDDLMDELQSATFQEAKSMVVSKSPVTPVFPSPTKSERSAHTVRTVSNPVRGTLLVPGDVSQSSARSVSTGAAFLHKVAQQPVGPNLAKKSNMGSSISQRIKALEKLSATSGDAPGRPVSTERPSSAFFSVRKGREPTRSPSVVDRANSFTRPTARTPPSRSDSQDESSDAAARQRRRDRSASVASRLSMFEPVSSEGGYSPSSTGTARGRPETISVTAKIIRDIPQGTSKPVEPPKDPFEYSHLALKESPLLVDHQKPVWTPVALEHNKEKEKDSHHERRMSKESNSQETTTTKSRRSSLSVVKDFIKERRRSVTSNSSDVLSPGVNRQPSRSPTRPPSTHQNTSFSQRLSISSRRSSFNKERDAVLSPTLTEGSVSSDESKSNSDKKTKSRAGRFMRRLSSLSSGSRAKIAVPPTGVSPTVTEEDTEPIRPATTAGTASIVAHMGDVNVQFPDNLLWKRRNMCLDAQGFLILSAIPGQSGRAAQSSKRYHLSEFRQPYLPDVEVQELPNSVVLDLMEGSGIQVACEDRAGQMKVLQTLQEAHRKNAARLGH